MNQLVPCSLIRPRLFFTWSCFQAILAALEPPEVPRRRKCRLLWFGTRVPVPGPGPQYWIIRDAIFGPSFSVSGHCSQYWAWYSDSILEALDPALCYTNTFSIKQQGSVKKIPRSSSILVTTIKPFNLQLKLQREWKPKLYFLVFI